MNSELIAVLDHMEREKGVSREVLVEAIESALVSAGKRILADKETEITAKVDLKTGQISVYSNGKRINSAEFGRIAAQTAKQVIIQKIRDAERDVIYDEFESRINNLVSGTVFRYEKGTVIIDFGKTEAILPKREQSPRDIYRQGDRIRVYLLEVTRTAKGPQIVVSRNHEGLVRKLFEMEVPEVLDGIVEIKNVAREAGDRTKIAVWSKDEKVDCVGACVGMRGSRVKNIVRELQGEKIDIVRWSEDVPEYVKAALSPAECVSVETRPGDQRVLVIVDDDQLSLAIGKNGQNVRLASKLTGWSIDIKSKAEIAKTLLGGDSDESEAAASYENIDSIDQIPGVTSKAAQALIASGINTLEKLSEMTREQLLNVEGVGPKTADAILAAAEHFKRTQAAQAEADIKSNLFSKSETKKAQESNGNNKKANSNEENG